MLCLVFDTSLTKLASLVTKLDLFGLLDLRRLHQTNSLELLASLAQTMPGLLDMLGLLDFALSNSLTPVFE